MGPFVTIHPSIHQQRNTPPQEPWILTASVRENVVVGRPFDARRYQAVLKAACLARDLREWEHGDQTIIGDRGVRG